MMQTSADDISHPVSSEVTTQLKDIKKTLPLRVLSEDDWNHWITKGYVIVRQAVPAEQAKALADVLWEFDEKDPNDASTWYAPQRRAHFREELGCLRTGRPNPSALRRTTPTNVGWVSTVSRSGCSSP